MGHVEEREGYLLAEEKEEAVSELAAAGKGGGVGGSAGERGWRGGGS